MLPAPNTRSGFYSRFISKFPPHVWPAITHSCSLTQFWIHCCLNLTSLMSTLVFCSFLSLLQSQISPNHQSFPLDQWSHQSAEKLNVDGRSLISVFILHIKELWITSNQLIKDVKTSHVWLKKTSSGFVFDAISRFILLILLSLPHLQTLWNVAELVMLTSSCHDIIWLINHHLTAFQIIKAAAVFAGKNNPTVSDVWWPISKLVYFQNPLKAVIHQLLQIVGGNIFSKFQLQAETRRY